MQERDLPNILANYCCDLIEWACEQGLTKDEALQVMRDFADRGRVSDIHNTPAPTRARAAHYSAQGSHKSTSPGIACLQRPARNPFRDEARSEFFATRELLERKFEEPRHSNDGGRVLTPQTID